VPPEAVTRRESIRIGRVVKAHGLTGELEIRPDWPGSRGLLDAPEVVLEAADGQCEVLSVIRRRQTPKGVLLLLEGISDRDAAEARRGQTVSVPRGSLPELEEGEYYLCDLVGLRVVSAEGLVGDVVEVQMYPSVDAIVILTPSGNRVEQPLLDQWLEEVDVAAGQITLASRDGLIEIPGAAPQSPVDTGEG